MINSFKANIKKVKYNISQFANNRTRKYIIDKFATKAGLLYFGSVDQNSDEHQIVRGFTVSASHQDNHYCIGTINGYNVTFVDRSDVVWEADGSMAVHNWSIMAFELHTKQDLPHIFIGAHNHDSKPYNMFFTTFPTIKEVHLGTFKDYSTEFTSRFSLYSRPNMAIKTEHLFPASTTRVMSTHFWPLSAEQNDHILYIYSTNQKITSHLLDTMLENGLWLAAHLDRQAELV